MKVQDMNTARYLAAQFGAAAEAMEAGDNQRAAELFAEADDMVPEAGVMGELLNIAIAKLAARVNTGDPEAREQFAVILGYLSDSDRALAGFDLAGVIHDLDGTDNCAADCSGCEVDPRPRR
jgi:hypothetical protein